MQAQKNHGFYKIKMRTTHHIESKFYDMQSAFMDYITSILKLNVCLNSLRNCVVNSTERLYCQNFACIIIKFVKLELLKKWRVYTKKSCVIYSREQLKTKKKKNKKRSGAAHG
eukprot:TRINITY_DN37968_c0_g1_i1.p1 TRINITY_DN37968_c0_g1~~TRINITY_DN37968_c0_g1_i1.p1  ORF type:complete len:113 (+),score=6.93 TRINITY_DN37968_c0_g1_i1:532-870(+)